MSLQRVSWLIFFLVSSFLLLDYVIHGDDPCIVDGKDVYETAKKAGKYQSIPRTEGVSTTDIVGRILLMNKDHHYVGDKNKEGEILRVKDKNGIGLLCDQSKFLTTRLVLVDMMIRQHHIILKFSMLTYSF